MKLKDETRRILILAFKNSYPSGKININRVVEESGRNRSTVRKHLNICLREGIIKRLWSRDYQIK